MAIKYSSWNYTGHPVQYQRSTNLCTTPESLNSAPKLTLARYSDAVQGVLTAYCRTLDRCADQQITYLMRTLQWWLAKPRQLGCMCISLPEASRLFRSEAFRWRDELHRAETVMANV